MDCVNTRKARKVFKNLRQEISKTKKEIKKKYSEKLEHLKKKYGKKNEEKLDMVPEDLKSYKEADVFDKKYSEIEEEGSTLIIIGE